MKKRHAFIFLNKRYVWTDWHKQSKQSCVNQAYGGFRESWSSFKGNQWLSYVHPEVCEFTDMGCIRISCETSERAI